MVLMQQEHQKPAGIIEDLHVEFFEQRVLHGIHLTLKSNRLAVIVGRSGSGKSTFLRSLNRLNECFPGCRSHGSVRLFLENRWTDIYDSDLPVARLRRRVAMVFQTPNVLPMSIERNVALPLRLVVGMSRAEAADRIEQALTEAQLWDEVKDRLKHPAATLSGGQQQRLCLARVLAMEPQFLLLDEPTASLDFRASVKIEELLLRLKEKYTIVAVSHSLSQARRLADQIIVFKEGLVVQSLDAQDFERSSTFRSLLEEIF